MPNFVVTTNPLNNPQPEGAIVVVDGTIPGWKPDYHWDHHRPGGGYVQIDEMLDAPTFTLADQLTVATTMVDADACVAATWLFLSKQQRKDNHERLWAIAADCDYLGVPREMAYLGDFAAQAVAAMKATGTQLAADLQLPVDRKGWDSLQKEAYASAAFRQGTLHLLDACLQQRPWPGQLGEAAEYWQQLQEDRSELASSGRIIIDRSTAVFDGRGISRYIDPRAWLAALGDVAPQRDDLKFTLHHRERPGGESYTLAVLPGNAADLSTLGVWQALGEAEAHLRATQPSASICWGGRATVGGSPWNEPSQLSPAQVIAVVEYAIELATQPETQTLSRETEFD